MGISGYFSEPAIHENKICFVSEDDLWLYDLELKGLATRITSSNGSIRSPVFNIDGNKIAFSSSEYGSYEIYIIDLDSAEIKRLTFLGEFSIVREWNSITNEIFFSTNYGSTPAGSFHLYKVQSNGGEPEPVNYGLAHTINHGISKNLVLGRFQDDNARWKNYKGGTAGQIWFSDDHKKFNRINLPDGNHVTPMIYKDRIYFLSDFQGLSNLYSVKSDSADLKQHTFESDYYLRKAKIGGDKIVLQKGGEIYIFNIVEEFFEKLKINYLSSRESTKKKYVPADKYLEYVGINNKDTHALIISRGKPFYFPFWEEGTFQIGKTQGIRYRHPAFHPTKDLLYIISDEFGEDRIEIYDLNDLNKEPDFIFESIGIPYSMKINSQGSHLSVFNNRMEILLIDLKDKSMETIYKPEFEGITSIDWSPDGKWISFAKFVNIEGSQIVLYNIESKKLYQITSGDFQDYHPRFGREGKYLYFLSDRTFNPMFDTQFFQYIFPKSTKIYAVALQKDTRSPISLKPQPVGNTVKGQSKNGKMIKEQAEEENDKKEEEEKFTIDFEGIRERFVELPVIEERIFNLEAAKDRLLFATAPIKGMDGTSLFDEPKGENDLKSLNLKILKIEPVSSGMSNFQLSSSGKTLIVREGKKVRLLPPEHLAKMDKNSGVAKGNTRESNYLDLSRIKLEVYPQKEWEQMMKETWKLMKDHYWEQNLGGINWELMLEKYLTLLPKISSRAELSDLMWELQGESKTSHSYEFGGDYKFPPDYRPAYLGVNMKFNGKGFEITKIYKGDYWTEGKGSPLTKPGINVEVGDTILAVDGQFVSEFRTVHELLMGKANQNVYLKIKKSSSGNIRTVSVKTLLSEFKLRYRDWVEQNRAYVHEKTKGKVGYFHLPNMMMDGVQEFYRYHKLETQRDGLIVDVRFNGGGHTSQIFLEKLSRKRLGYVSRRYGKAGPYPAYSVPGPMVALTNQNAGSDGDIFSHGFKMLKLGTLIGTRTWGGVVGIWPKVRLVDGSIVTQPEYSFWFNDVHWKVENYGTDPDIEVDITPEDYFNNADPQLDKGIEVVLEQLQNNPVEYPDLSQKPLK